MDENLSFPCISRRIMSKFSCDDPATITYLKMLGPSYVIKAIGQACDVTSLEILQAEQAMLQIFKKDHVARADCPF